LSDIKTAITQHFTNNDDGKRFISELARLQSIKLRSQLPDISVSLKMLRDVTKLRIETDKTLTTDEIKPGQEESPKVPADSAESTNPVDKNPPAEAVQPKQRK
jgi:uncharacterized protein HemX